MSQVLTPSPRDPVRMRLALYSPPMGDAPPNFWTILWTGLVWQSLRVRPTDCALRSRTLTVRSEQEADTK